MADQELIDNIAQGDLIIGVDATRNDYDLRTLPTVLRSLLTTRLAAARAANAAVAMAAGGEAGASAAVADAVARLAAHLRNGYNWLKAIPTEDVPASEVLEAMESYGWEGGKIGELTATSRIIALSELALAVTPDLPAATRYPANVVTRITTWLGVYSGNKIIANGGNLQTILDDKDAKRELLARAISRVRYHYCAGGDEGEYSVELSRIGYQPKRLPGDAQPAPLPEALGVATFNAATRELTVPELSSHTTSLVAFRKPLGGDSEQAGVSTTNIVGVSDFSPLVVGVTYALSVKPRNSRGFGPESNIITFTA